MSSYRNQISCCVSDQVAADLSDTAVKREITVAALVRQAIVRELYNCPVLIPEVHKYMLFITFAIDELMRVHADAGLRSRATNAWQGYLAEQERRHAD